MIKYPATHVGPRANNSADYEPRLARNMSSTPTLGTDHEYQVLLESVKNCGSSKHLKPGDTDQPTTWITPVIIPPSLQGNDYSPL